MLTQVLNVLNTLQSNLKGPSISLYITVAERDKLRHRGIGVESRARAL